MAKKPRAKSAKEPTLDQGPPPQPVPLHSAPIPLASILGQPRAVATLHAAMRSDRVHHAWIFHGPTGVGKLTTALAFAATLLDPTTAPNLAGNPEPDPQSHVQRLLRAGTHPDLHVISKELARFHPDPLIRERKLITIPKEVIELHLVEPAKLGPSLQSNAAIAKVFIVDEAELLDRSPTNAPTQNSILKTLEEPDGKTVIILVTSSPDRLLPTIRSRSQQVRFAPLDKHSLRSWASSRDMCLPADEIDWLLEQSEGSPGEVLRAIEFGVPGWRTRLAPLLADASRGKYSSSLAPAITESIEAAAAGIVAASAQASKEAATRSAASRMFRFLSRHYRIELRRTLDPAAQTTTHDNEPRALRSIDAVQRAQRLVDSQVQLPFIAEWLSGELAAT